MSGEEIVRLIEETGKIAAKIAGVREVCLRCGYVWASWNESHECERQPIQPVLPA